MAGNKPLNVCLHVTGRIVIDDVTVACPSCAQATGPWLLTATADGRALTSCGCGNRFQNPAVTTDLIYKNAGPGDEMWQSVDDAETHHLGRAATMTKGA